MVVWRLVPERDGLCEMVGVVSWQVVVAGRNYNPVKWMDGMIGR